MTARSGKNSRSGAGNERAHRISSYRWTAISGLRRAFCGQAGRRRSAGFQPASGRQAGSLRYSEPIACEQAPTELNMKPARRMLEPRALELVEEAVHLLRGASAATLAIYYAGAVPFVL